MSTVREHIALERSARAAAAGLFGRLPGAGQPLDLGDEWPVPPEVRMANRILRNADCLPLELESRKAARDPVFIAAVEQERAVMRARFSRLGALRSARESTGLPSRPAWARYGPQLLRRFTRRP